MKLGRRRTVFHLRFAETILEGERASEWGSERERGRKKQEQHDADIFNRKIIKGNTRGQMTARRRSRCVTDKH